MTAQDKYESYFAEKIWALIPEVYRTEDGQAQNPDVLRQIVEVIAGQAAITRRSIDRLWEDQSIETCDDWAVPYIGDLVSTRPVTELDTRGRRVSVARTIFYRRRRGTPHILELLVSELSGWDVVLVEAFRRLARTRHRLDVAPAPVGLFTRTPQGGTADLRSARSAELVDTPFDEFFRTVDVRRLRGFDGRFNIRKLNFHLFRRNSYEIDGADPYFMTDPGIPTYTFDPSGRDIPLFARGTDDTSDTDCSSPEEWEIKKPIPCRLLGHAEYFLTARTLDEVTGAPPQVAQIVGEHFRSEGSLAERLIGLGTPGVRVQPWYRTLLALAITDQSNKNHLYPDSVSVGLLGENDPTDPFLQQNVTSGNLGCRTVHPIPADTGVELIIDPELGRFAHADQTEITDPPPFVRRYFYGFTGEVGAGAYPRGEIVPGGDVAVPAIPGNVTNPGVQGSQILTFEDHRTYILLVPPTNTIANAVVQSGDAKRPYVRLSTNVPGGEAAEWTPVDGGGARLRLDGIWFGALNDAHTDFIIAKADPPAADGAFDWDEIIIENCTLDPGGARSDGKFIKPMRLFVLGRVRRLVISRSILGPIEIPCDEDEPDEAGFVETLEIRDSIVDATKVLVGEEERQVAIFSSEGEVRLQGVTVLGDLHADVLNATDTVVMGTVNVLDQFHSCFRFSAASPGGTLPKLFHAEPKAISEGNPLGPILPVYFHSLRFGDPGYGEIALNAPEFLRTGSEVGSELGAFSWLLRPIRLATVINKVEEFKPVGMLAQYLLEGELNPLFALEEPEEPDDDGPIFTTEDDVIVFTPLDADLNGAPRRWVEGNWRPRPPTAQAASGSILGVPFDHCDLVLEYDARRGTAPNLQGWTPIDSAVSLFGTLQPGGALGFNVPSGSRASWQQHVAAAAMPTHAVAYAMFMVDDVGGTADQGEGFDMAVQAKGASADWSGMRAAWGDELEYIRLNGALDTEVATAQIVHRVHRAWHTMSLDADFGDNTGIGTIDNLVNKESLSGTFGTTNQPAVSGPRLLARFGVTDNDESASGRLRNFVASAPGRFVRASFRGFATSSSMLLRLVFVVDAGDASGQATFKVRYCSVASATFNPYDESTSTMHEATATVTVAAATDLNVIHIVNVTLSDGVTPNIPLWFSIERNPGDTLDQTIHLLEAVLSATPS